MRQIKRVDEKFSRICLPEPDTCSLQMLLPIMPGVAAPRGENKNIKKREWLPANRDVIPGKTAPRCWNLRPQRLPLAASLASAWVRLSRSTLVPADFLRRDAQKKTQQQNNTSSALSKQEAVRGRRVATGFCREQRGRGLHGEFGAALPLEVKETSFEDHHEDQSQHEQDAQDGDQTFLPSRHLHCRKQCSVALFKVSVFKSFLQVL